MAAEVPELQMSAAVFHNTDSTSSLFVQIDNENLLYKRPDTSNNFFAHLRVVYHLMLEGNSRKVLDSASVQLFDQAGASTVSLKSLFTSFTVKAYFGSNYTLRLEVFDMNRRNRYTQDYPVLKSGRYSAQNFLILRRDSISYTHTFVEGESIKIRYADSSVKRLYAECFLKGFGPALPPFSTREPDPLKYKPDSSFVLDRKGEYFEVKMPPRGFYHLKIEEGQQQGVTVFTYDESFPGVSSSEEMIDCARYLMSRDEFESCKNAADKKKAIDAFWLSLGGSNERARELLRRYYGRVKEANRQYTSYTQGWKTDRGMIYIIFGRPVNIYKGRKDEVWVYGNEANPATLRFVFNKTENPYSDNDYVMERSQFYKDPWHTAVDFWRQGHVYMEGRRY